MVQIGIRKINIFMLLIRHKAIQQIHRQNRHKHSVSLNFLILVRKIYKRHLGIVDSTKRGEKTDIDTLLWYENLSLMF